jgi:hypothetical protein
MIRDRFEIREVPGVCQLVIVDDGVSLPQGKNVANEIGTNESRAAGH